MKKILCVDDEDSILKLYIGILGVGGYDTIVAANDREALTAMRLDRPPVVLMDLSLGANSLDGIELSKQIKSLYPETKIVVVSGNLFDFAEHTNCKNCLFSGVMVKPIHVSELLRVIGEMFDG